MNINPSQDVVVPHSEEGEMGNVNIKSFLEVEKEGWKNPYILHGENYETLPELLIAYENWWIRTRHMPSTARKNSNALKRLANHAVYPINLRDLNPMQIINCLEYQEHTEKIGPYGIRNNWKALKSLADSYGIDLEKQTGYRPPSPPPAKIRILPLPNEVKQQINYRYTKNKLVNKTIQYILTHGYLFGFRPEEFPIQRIDNIRLSNGYIIIIEAKKHYQLRQLFPEKELLTGDRRKSIKNLLKLHDKINPNNPFLYIQPNGRPWTVDWLRNWLCGYIKPVFPDFSMYVMRHWCATARLIKSYEETGLWDKEDVKDWLGHDDLRTTDDYTKYAKKYYNLAPYDWIKAVLKANKKISQKNSLDQRTPKTLNISDRATGEDKYGPTGILIVFLLLKKPKKPAFSTSLFLFSLEYSSYPFSESPYVNQRELGDNKLVTFWGSSSPHILLVIPQILWNNNMMGVAS